eukprot:1067371-Pelagomonas_calceolata.AAC.2
MLQAALANRLYFGILQELHKAGLFGPLANIEMRLVSCSLSYLSYRRFTITPPPVQPENCNLFFTTLAPLVQTDALRIPSLLQALVFPCRKEVLQ